MDDEHSGEVRQRTSNTELLRGIRDQNTKLDQMLQNQHLMQQDLQLTRMELTHVKTNLDEVGKRVDRNTGVLWGTNGDKPGIGERLRSLEKSQGNADKVLWLIIGGTVTSTVVFIVNLILH